MRRKSRDYAFKLIYQDLFAIDNAFENDETLNEEENEYAQQILNAYLQNKTQITDVIKANLKGYEMDRLYKIDLALILLALTENFYFSVPKAVEINEILELAKIYSTEKSPSFINGLLKEILK